MCNTFYFLFSNFTLLILLSGLESGDNIFVVKKWIYSVETLGNVNMVDILLN